MMKRLALALLASPVLSQTQCADDGADYSWSDTVSGSTRTIVTNHCPNHATAEMNPNYAVNSQRTYTIPAVPEYSASQETNLAAQGGITGVTFDAAMMHARASLNHRGLFAADCTPPHPTKPFAQSTPRPLDI